MFLVCTVFTESVFLKTGLHRAPEWLLSKLSSLHHNAAFCEIEHKKPATCAKTTESTGWSYFSLWYSSKFQAWRMMCFWQVWFQAVWVKILGICLEVVIVFVILQDLNVAHGHMAELHNHFFGLPHMFALVKLLGSRSLPWLVRALLDNLSQKVSSIRPIFMFIVKKLAIMLNFHDPTLRVQIFWYSGELTMSPNTAKYVGQYKVEAVLSILSIWAFWLLLWDVNMDLIDNKYLQT